MGEYSDSPSDRLWWEYGQVFQDFDDLRLARWMSQTLSQLHGRIWRYSHPLVGTYRLAAHTAYQRQLWLKRLAQMPGEYAEADCCRAPLLPMVTRDVLESGLLCLHCNATAVAFDSLSKSVRSKFEEWAGRYAPIHAVAHWDDRQRKAAGNYDSAYEDAAQKAEGLLGELGKELAPLLLEEYAVVVWEDQDECLEVRPEDVVTVEPPAAPPIE